MLKRLALGVVISKPLMGTLVASIVNIKLQESFRRSTELEILLLELQAANQTARLSANRRCDRAAFSRMCCMTCFKRFAEENSEQKIVSPLGQTPIIVDAVARTVIVIAV